MEMFSPGSKMNVEINRGIYIYILVGSLEHFLFSHILGIIIPND